MSLPNIPHATVSYNARGRVVIQMDEGWVYYNTESYADLTDDEGNPREPYPEEISYFRYGVYSPTTDFSVIVVVA